jgi:hypothetical protein
MTTAKEETKMTRTDHIDSTEKELDCRTSDGIEVSLLWTSGAKHVIVEVVDSKTGAAFRLEVAATEAFDAFQHPYAYAAFRGVEYVEPWQLQTEPVST